MAIHYNAFISYRHHPDDIRVAGEIHRSLERFHVPKAIRQRTGKIDRLFRDKEELPITSDLNDDIDMALANSDYLIVICSVHTKESVWVQREIELFLKTHDRNRVLTVLASGEPYDVIPEILLYEDKVDPVTGEVKRIAYEPLSCDWRMKMRKAKQEELPRLAAALLGCGYDELRQRQKQYRARRLTAILSTAAVASTCLAAYFLYTSITIARANEEIRLANIRIQENLDEALTNQSQHLATAARQRLEEGDRLTALSLAVSALPDENNIRPYVPEAEKVLAEALGIYDTVNHMAAVGTLSPGVNVGIRNFWVTESERVMYLYDSRGTFTAWDLGSLEKTGEFYLGNGYFDSFMVLPNENALLLAGEYGKDLYCYDPAGNLLWQRGNCIELTIQDDGMLLCIEMKTITEYNLVRLDPETGDTVAEMALPLGDSATTPSSFLVKEQPAQMAVPIRYYTYGTTRLYTANWETGEVQPLDLGTDYPYCARLLEDGKLVLMDQPNGLGLAGAYGSDRVTSPETCPLRCYDLASGELLWENEISSSVAGGKNLEALTGGRVLCQLGNVFLVLDGETGELLGRCDAGSSVLSLAVEDTCVTAVLQDGYACYYWYESGYCYERKFARNDVTLACVGQNLYLQHTEGDHVTVYRSMTAAAEWATVIGVEMGPQCQILRGNALAYQDSNYIYLFDLASRELVWATERSGGELLGFSEDGSRMFCLVGANVLAAVDVATGKAEGHNLPLQQDDRLIDNLLLQEDTLYYAVNGSNGPRLICVDMHTWDGQAYALVHPEGTDGESNWWHLLGTKEDKVWLWLGQQYVVQLDLSTEETILVVPETTQRPVIAFAENGTMALANNFGITLRSPEGEETFLSLEGSSAGSLCFYGEELLALCDNGFLYRFAAEGTVLSRTKLEVDSRFGDHLMSSDADAHSILWQFTPEGKLVINARGMGNVIDCGTWGLTAALTEFLAWDPVSGTLVCSLQDTLAGFPMYSTGELMELARQELGSFTLTDEQQAAYGID